MVLWQSGNTSLQGWSTYTIPPKSNTANPWECDFHVYKERHLVECFFNKLKQFRRIATRYDKLAASFTAFVYIAAILIFNEKLLCLSFQAHPSLIYFTISIYQIYPLPPKRKRASPTPSQLFPLKIYSSQKSPYLQHPSSLQQP